MIGFLKPGLLGLTREDMAILSVSTADRTRETWLQGVRNSAHAAGVENPGCALQVLCERCVRGPLVCAPTSKGFLKELNVQRFFN